MALVFEIPVSRILMERLNVHRHVNNQSARARGCELYMNLIFVMTGQNIFNDGDKGIHLHQPDVH